MAELTLKQEHFVKAYIETGNASEAYRIAYDADKMKAETIHRKANELISNGKITARIEEMQKEHQERHKITVDNLVDQLEEAARVTKEYLEGIAKTYGAEATVTVEARRDRMTFVFDTDKQGLLIGKHGKILNALQVLAQVSVHRFIKGRISVQVDVGDYRQRRSETLQQIAERTARKVLKTKQPVYLEPLPAYERKQIHAALSKNKRISTHSEGKEPHRYLVVEIAE